MLEQCTSRRVQLKYGLTSLACVAYSLNFSIVYFVERTAYVFTCLGDLVGILPLIFHTNTALVSN